MKKSFLIEKDDIEFRRARLSDNLEEIAELIYLTDPYIYPFWFDNDIEAAKKYLTTLIKKDANLFNINNFYIAIQKDTQKIVGILCAIDKSVNLLYDYQQDKKINEKYKFTIEHYIEEVEREIKESIASDYVYISNICISENLRGKKIGTYLMGYFISQLENNGYNTFGLDCLLHNLRAKNLYHSMGFKEMKEFIGFDGTEKSKVEVVKFLRKKGNYYPSEFQVTLK